jgi:hypothetical protein
MKNVSLLGAIELTTMPWNVFVGLNTNLISASHHPIENAVNLFCGRGNHENGKIRINLPTLRRSSFFFSCRSMQNAIPHPITSNLPHKLDDSNHTTCGNELKLMRLLDYM